MKRAMTDPLRMAAAGLLALVVLAQPVAHAYVLNHTIAASGGCPEMNRFQTATAGIVDRRWSTSLNTSPVTIKTQDQTANGRIQEIHNMILESFSVWTGVGTSLTASSLAPQLNQVGTQNACNSTDGLNTICFNQTDAGFTAGVLAFTRVVNSDIPGEQPFPNNPPATLIGEILDADILFKPNDANTTFATPQALATNPSSFDFESVLVHELGHFFGFSHSSVLRAMMYPFVPPTGTFLGERPSQAKPDGPLADDDRVGLRVLYPNPQDTTNIGTISGFILPANPISLSGLPVPSAGRSVTGVFGTQVVAVDADSGAVVAATLGGWSCDPASPPTNFDGFYKIARLPVGRNYKIFVEPLDLPTDSTNITGALSDLCRSGVPQPCTVPAVNTNFTTKIRP